MTTVRDNQVPVQIDLFQKGETLEYIGSLIVEDIAQKKAGESTISLKLEVDENENLKAEAADLDSGAGQTLKVSLAAVTPNDEGNDFNLNDFELSPQKDFSEMSSENFISETTAEREAASFGAGEKKFPKWLAAILILLGIAVLVLAVLLLGRSCSNKKPASGDDVASIKVPAPETTSKVPEPANDTINVTGSSSEAKTGNESGRLKAIKRVVRKATVPLPMRLKLLQMHQTNQTRRVHRLHLERLKRVQLEQRKPQAQRKKLQARVQLLQLVMRKKQPSFKQILTEVCGTC